MTDAATGTAGPMELTEDRIPVEGLDETVDELVELYGGEMKETGERRRRFVLPLRRGISVSGGVECTLVWSADDAHEGTVTLTCDRDIDAPRGQRIAMLVAGVIGALLFTVWPFFLRAATELGTVAWIGGAIAIAVYVMTLRKTAGGIAFDFLRRLARRQREAVATDAVATTHDEPADGMEP